MSETVPCERCTGVDRILNERGYFCPCCKSVLKTGEMIRRQAAARASEMGLTLDEYRTRMREQYGRTDTGGISDEKMAKIQATVKERAAEWKPACEHDTENPWL